MGCSDADITSIKEGFKEALGKPILAVLTFRDWAQTFSWFANTLHAMSQVRAALQIKGIVWQGDMLHHRVYAYFSSIADPIARTLNACRCLLV